MQPEIDFAVLARMNLPSKTYGDGQTIFAEGDAADHMFLVREGHVVIEHRGKLLDDLGPGDILGEMGIIDGTPRSATARAIGACQLAILNEKNFIYLVDEMPYFALKMMRVLSRRLKAMNDKV